jgi:hypothetical protein
MPPVHTETLTFLMALTSLVVSLYALNQLRPR